MDPHQQSNLPRSPLPLHSISPAQASQLLQRTANSTPVSSPGLFSPTPSRMNMSLLPHPVSEGTTPAPTTQTSKNNSLQSPYLHPLQTRKVRETFTANVDRDYTTGRKHINQYEVRQEIGRGQHGKVKLAYNTQTEENVAIKIIPRFSKKRRLGKVTAEDPQRNTKREIAILKKIRHPNVVALLEVIDDPELKKIYMVLEHVELGEITWRKKGLPTICHLERRMWERGQRGESLSAEEEEYLRQLQRKQAKKDQLRALAKQRQQDEPPNDNPHNWSLEYGAFEDDDLEVTARLPPLGKSPAGSRVVSQAPSRTQSARSLSRVPTPLHPSDPDLQSLHPIEDDILEYPIPIRPGNGNAPASALDGTMLGPYADDVSVAAARARSPSMADSIISHMSSMDFGTTQPHDPFADDFSYVPCFTFEAARRAFRDTVLGLEYLHYNGVVHRDIKPANLLWTKDLRVKISDFGVSYFGRPVRDGEPVESVPEAEAHDFDDDRELAKTVGTPAFFAPELCYTDLDQEQPKVTEQIDVWSLGVTLYCIIFARIPFLAEDEFLMFRMIATEDVYIPRRRLRPVAPFTDPTKTSLFNRENGAPYRDDEDPSYEDIDDDLFDLLQRMLEKDPQKRIRLSEVKSHPWLLRDITNILNWMSETDPSRELAGRQIEVDEREVGEAVVPITFLERARSTVKKIVHKVIPHRSEKGEGSSRRRATSSVGSSGAESMANSPPVVPNPRDARRQSIRGDDFFATITQMPTGDHPLSQSVTHTPQDSPSASSPANGSLASRRAARIASGLGQETSDDSEKQNPSNSAVPSKPLPRHANSRSALMSLNCGFHHESHTSPPTPRTGDVTRERTGREPDMSLDPVAPRTRSMDRAGIIFASPDKHARPAVGVNTTAISGRVQQPPRSPRPVKSVDLGAALNGSGKHSPSFFPRLTSQYLHGHPKSETNIRDKRRSMVEVEERPTTAHRVESRHSGESFVPASSSYPGQSFREATPAVPIQGRHQSEQQQRHEQNLAIRTSMSSNPSRGRAASSPTGEYDGASMSRRHQVPSRDATMSTAVSSSYTSMGAIAGTPLTSPSVVTSPACITSGSAPPSREASDSVAAMLAFQSDPSLPALLSGASSVSADVEGDFLGNPGVVDGRTTSLIGTTDSLTPPAPAKESMSEFPLEQHDMDNADAIAVRLDSARDTPRGATSSPRPPAIFAAGPSHDSFGDSDSDDGLIMSSKKSKSAMRSPTSAPSPSPSHLQQPPQHYQAYQPVGTLAKEARRRDTNTSIGSTETAKKIDVGHSENAPMPTYVARETC